MSKYSNEFKLKVVNAYLLGEGGAGTIGVIIKSCGLPKKAYK